MRTERIEELIENLRELRVDFEKTESTFKSKEKELVIELEHILEENLEIFKSTLGENYYVTKDIYSKKFGVDLEQNRYRLLHSESWVPVMTLPIVNHEDLAEIAEATKKYPEREDFLDFVKSKGWKMY